MGREGCLKEDICCDWQLEVSGFLMLENMSKKMDYDRHVEWAHRMLSVLHVFWALDLLIMTCLGTDL